MPQRIQYLSGWGDHLERRRKEIFCARFLLLSTTSNNLMIWTPQIDGLCLCKQMSFKTRFLWHFVWKSVGFKAFAFRLKFFKLGQIYAHFSFLKFFFFFNMICLNWVLAFVLVPFPLILNRIQLSLLFRLVVKFWGFTFKHCQRHYGPRRWLLWPVILVW